MLNEKLINKVRTLYDYYCKYIFIKNSLLFHFL